MGYGGQLPLQRRHRGDEEVRRRALLETLAAELEYDILTEDLED